MAEYPKTITIKLSLEIQVSDLESESYFLAEPEDNLPSMKFLADLFDILVYEGSLGVEKINGFTTDQIAKKLNQIQNQS